MKEGRFLRTKRRYTDRKMFVSCCVTFLLWVHFLTMDEPGHVRFRRKPQTSERGHHFLSRL